MRTKITLLITLILTVALQAQTLVSDFESFTLAPNSFYHDTNSTPFTTAHAKFPYEWTKGGFPYWSGGFSYTNKYDSSTASYTNLHGVRAYKGNNNSAIYTVAKDRGIIHLSVAQATVNGFYYTNTTYAYKSIKSGDSFSRKFGDTTGTGSGTTIAQGSYPDFFKVTIKGFKNGALKTDSVEFFLADYRFPNNSQDYIVDDWRFITTSILGEVDSLQFFMHSTVFDQFGMLTPGFFAIDDFSTTVPIPTGIKRGTTEDIAVYPNPCTSTLRIIRLKINAEAHVRIRDLYGNVLREEFLRSSDHEIDLQSLNNGIYFLELLDVTGHHTHRIIKTN